MRPRAIFVDGYNLIYATPAFATLLRADSDAARAALLQRLVSRYRHTPHEVIVVFDGAGTAQTSQAIAGFTRGRVVFSASEETADSVIVRLATEWRETGGEAIVYSNDGEVRLGAERGGAVAASADDLRAEMISAPRLLRKRFTHQQAVRRDWSADGDAEERAAARKKGNARRPPRKRDR
jgi:predicted RNA-binding protein with PIN domain